MAYHCEAEFELLIQDEVTLAVEKETNSDFQQKTTVPVALCEVPPGFNTKSILTSANELISSSTSK